MRLVLRLILMGIGLGVLTGSALKVLAPQVEINRYHCPNGSVRRPGCQG